MNIAILLSGGTGTRLGANIPKQYIRVANKMIITYSLKVLLEHPQIDGIVIVAEEKWQDVILEEWNNIILKELATNQNSGKDLHKYDKIMEKPITFTIPGVTRQFSIWNALNEIKQKWNMETVVTNILIHDAARPNLSSDMISQCMNILTEHDGVMPILPMKDTIYESDDGKTITNLLDRSRLFAGQAPEGFRFELYYEANQKLLSDSLHKINGATEPAILAGMDVAMILGDENNFKITTTADLERFYLLNSI